MKYLPLIILLALAGTLIVWQVDPTASAQAPMCVPAESPGPDGVGGGAIIDPDCPGRVVDPSVPPTGDGVEPEPPPEACVSFSLTADRVCIATGNPNKTVSYLATVYNHCPKTIESLEYTDNQGNTESLGSLNAGASTQTSTYSLTVSQTTLIAASLRGVLEGESFVRQATLTIAVRDSCDGCQYSVAPLSQLDPAWGYPDEQKYWCGITSFSMLTDYYDSYKNPKEVYEYCCVNCSGGCYDWSNCGGQWALGSSLGVAYLPTTQEEYIQGLWSLLCGRAPVIAKVSMSTAGGGVSPHFVLVTGVDSAQVIFNDPWYGTERTLSHADFFQKVVGGRTYDIRYH